MKTVNMPERNIMFTPGPATTTEAVKLALITKDMSPRDEEFIPLLAKLRRKVTELVAPHSTFSSVLLSCSGTAAVEAMLLAAARQSQKILIINNGAYGHRMVEIAQAYQINYQVYDSSPLVALNISDIEAYLSTNKNEFAYIAVVHHETTTGLLNNLNELKQICKPHGIKLLVDAMSSYAALPIDMVESAIDILACSSNKNIQGMPGVGMVVFKRDAIENLSNYPSKCYYLDIIAEYFAQENKHQGRFTLPVQCIFSLEKAFSEYEEEGGQAKRFQRYHKNYQLIVSGMEKLGFSFLLNSTCQSGLIASVLVPEHKNFKLSEFTDFLKQDLIDIYPGKLANTNYFRMCTIGDLYPEDIEYALNKIERYLLIKTISLKQLTSLIGG